MVGRKEVVGSVFRLDIVIRNLTIWTVLKDCSDFCNFVCEKVRKNFTSVVVSVLLSGNLNVIDSLDYFTVLRVLVLDSLSILV